MRVSWFLPSSSLLLLLIVSCGYRHTFAHVSSFSSRNSVVAKSNHQPHHSSRAKWSEGNRHHLLKDSRRYLSRRREQRNSTVAAAAAAAAADAITAPWRITDTRTSRRRSNSKRHRIPLALPIHGCPQRFSAVVKARNDRTYLFADDRVYQTWHDEKGLQQKNSYPLSDMFPDGPQKVVAALASTRSSVLTLFDDRHRVYRYKWHDKDGRFQLTSQGGVRELNATFTPYAAFEWIDGNPILLGRNEFAIYDSHHNVATFQGATTDYFPRLPSDLLGFVHADRSVVVVYTTHNVVKIFDTKEFRVSAQFPVSVADYAGCVS